MDKTTLGLEAFGLFVLIVYAIATIAIWCANKEAAEAAKSAADTAATQLELAQRPWVSTDIDITSPLVFDSNGLHVEVKLTAKNDGNSPAVNVWVKSELYIPRLKHPTSTDERGTFCGEAAASWSDRQGRTLLPKSPRPEEEFYTLTAANGDIQEAARSPYANGSFAATIIVCTIYESTFTKQRLPYFSNTAYHLFQVLPDEKVSAAFETGKNVPTGRLAILPWFGGVNIR